LVDQTSLELRSLVKQDGALELSLAHVTVSTPKDVGHYHFREHSGTRTVCVLAKRSASQSKCLPAFGVN
jgi:hypothetical protein